MEASDRMWFRFDLRRLLMATALVALGIWEMFHLVTPSHVVWLGGCAVIGLTFGAAAGLLANALRICIALSVVGWLAFGIFAIAS